VVEERCPFKNERKYFAPYARGGGFLKRFDGITVPGQKKRKKKPSRRLRGAVLGWRQKD